jgi:hypothetical protein
MIVDPASESSTVWLEADELERATPPDCGTLIDAVARALREQHLATVVDIRSVADAAWPALQRGRNLPQRRPVPEKNDLAPDNAVDQHVTRSVDGRAALCVVVQRRQRQRVAWRRRGTRNGHRRVAGDRLTVRVRDRQPPIACGGASSIQCHHHRRGGHDDHRRDRRAAAADRRDQPRGAGPWIDEARSVDGDRGPSLTGWHRGWRNRRDRGRCLLNASGGAFVHGAEQQDRDGGCQSNEGLHERAESG